MSSLKCVFSTTFAIVVTFLLGNQAVVETFGVPSDSNNEPISQENLCLCHRNISCKTKDGWQRMVDVAGDLLPETTSLRAAKLLKGKQCDSLEECAKEAYRIVIDEHCKWPEEKWDKFYEDVVTICKKEVTKSCTSDMNGAECRGAQSVTEKYRDIQVEYRNSGVCYPPWSPDAA